MQYTRAFKEPHGISCRTEKLRCLMFVPNHGRLPTYRTNKLFTVPVACCWFPYTLKDRNSTYRPRSSKLRIAVLCKKQPLSVVCYCTVSIWMFMNYTVYTLPSLTIQYTPHFIWSEPCLHVDKQARYGMVRYSKSEAKARCNLLFPY